MKVRTSITLSESILKEIDKMLEDSDHSDNRSNLIEEALREFIQRNRRKTRDRTDLELINNSADELNKEAEDTLSYQVDI
jgi:metal-responsive CopG/Arc/MetJ family transcriptional regulator